MSTRTKMKKSALMVGASLVAMSLGAQANAQDAAASVEEVVVTGSRIATMGTTSPTPLTVVSTQELQQTTPSNLPDGLNKLPVFQGSTQPRTPGAGGNLNAQNVLSLRGFGAQRTLVLIDGHRAAPSNANGTVDVDTIPQMLVQRVDVVTGGASAVYGSDAVTGVINFILDKNFTGLKVDANAGISTYGDGESYKFGIAAGEELFGGRGHMLGSYQRREQDDVDNFDRPYGSHVYVLTGNGSANAPFTVSDNIRRADSTFGGKIQGCTAPCPANGMQFISNGVIGPFVPGRTTGTANQNSGGDGAYSPFSTALVSTMSDEAFGRFSYDFSDDLKFYVQGTYAKSVSTGWHFPAKLTPGNGQASTFYKNNPFLSAAVRTQLGDNGRTDSSNTFQLGTYIINTNGGQKGQNGTRGTNEYTSIETGLSGNLGAYRWDVFYTHGDNDQVVQSRHNPNYQRQFASLDAVVGPNGTVQCYAATQAATAAAYRDCVPLNAFGPTAISQDAFDWFTEQTYFNMRNRIDNVGGSLTGTAFQGWAGPIDFALSGEARWNKYSVRSNASPTATVNCTGLRICNPNLPLWAQNVLAEVDAENNVWEVAGEVLVPLLADLPLVQNFSANLAGRYTDYSTSGSVETWKIGLDWSVNDNLRFRGTTSRDIRAPTLNDLFQPVQAAVSGFVDLHTATSNTVFVGSSGNPNLVPEVARTYTAGVVFTPQFFNGFTASLDFYKISMDNAIGAVSASNNTVQRLCEDSGGTSPYCSLFQRPLPFSDRTSANFPTRVSNLSLNTAFTEVKGVDFEANYRFEALGGRWSARVFGNRQPTNVSQSFAGAALTRVAAPKTRVTTFLNYTRGDLTVGLQDRWLSGYSLITSDGQNWVDPDVGSFNTVDANVEWKFSPYGTQSAVYFTVQNLANARPDIVAAGGSVGINYPVPAGQDIMGRYYTIGLRTRF